MYFLSLVPIILLDLLQRDSKLLATFLRCFASKLARAPHVPLLPYLETTSTRAPARRAAYTPRLRRISPTTLRSGPRATRYRDDPAAEVAASKTAYAPLIPQLRPPNDYEPNGQGLWVVPGIFCEWPARTATSPDPNAFFSLTP